MAFTSVSFANVEPICAWGNGRASCCLAMPNGLLSGVLVCPECNTRQASDHSSALPQDTVVAIKQGGDNLTISNMDETKYPTATFSVDPKQVCTAALPNSISVPKNCWCSESCLHVYPYLNSLDESQRVDLEHHTWANYFLAAYKVCRSIQVSLSMPFNSCQSRNIYFYRMVHPTVESKLSNAWG